MNGSKSNVERKADHADAQRGVAKLRGFRFSLSNGEDLHATLKFFTELLCMQVASETLLPNGESVVRLVDSSYTMQRGGSDASVGIEFQCRKTETAMVRESYGMMPILHGVELVFFTLDIGAVCQKD